MPDFPAVPFTNVPFTTDLADSYDYVLLPGGGTPTPTLVTNRVWYVPGGFEVRWQTASPDVGGASYPGPGTFGVDTTSFTVDDPSNVS